MLLRCPCDEVIEGNENDNQDGCVSKIFTKQMPSGFTLRFSRCCGDFRHSGSHDVLIQVLGEFAQYGDRLIFRHYIPFWGNRKVPLV